MSRIRLANVVLKFICEKTNLPMCTSLRPGGGPAERSEQHCAGRRSTLDYTTGSIEWPQGALWGCPIPLARLRRRASKEKVSLGTASESKLRRSSYSGTGRTSASGPMTRRAAAQNLGPLGARSRALHNGFAPSLPRRRWAARPRQRQRRWPATRGAFE